MTVAPNRIKNPFGDLMAGWSKGEVAPGIRRPVRSLKKRVNPIQLAPWKTKEGAGLGAN